jgi:hypothetical protein
MKLHPVERDSPMEFCYQKYYHDSNTKEWKEDRKSIPVGRKRNIGYSDHFPIQCLLDIVE